MAETVTIGDYLLQVRAAIAGLPKEVTAIIERNKAEILDLNRYDQLYEEGIDSDGRLLKPYSPTTVQYKRFFGQPYNRTTLFDKGDFYRGFDILQKPDTINIFSRDSKSSELVEKYGNIFGLTTENERIFNQEILLPEINAFIAKYL